MTAAGIWMIAALFGLWIASSDATGTDALAGIAALLGVICLFVSAALVFTT